MSSRVSICLRFWHVLLLREGEKDLILNRKDYKPGGCTNVEVRVLLTDLCKAPLEWNTLVYETMWII